MLLVIKLFYTNRSSIQAIDISEIRYSYRVLAFFDSSSCLFRERVPNVTRFFGVNKDRLPSKPLFIVIALFYEHRAVIQAINFSEIRWGC